MRYQKNMSGYYIDVATMDHNKKLHDFRKASKKLRGIFNKYLETVTLRYDGIEIEDYNAWQSDGPDGLARKLQEWSRLEPYYTYELDDDQKEAYIDRMIKNYVYTRDYEWLQETFNDAMDTYECETEQELYEVFNYYNDISLSEIASYLWDVFYDRDTMQEIDTTLESILGHYGDAMIAKIEGEGYYLFFH